MRYQCKQVPYRPDKTVETFVRSFAYCRQSRLWGPLSARQGIHQQGRVVVEQRERGETFTKANKNLSIRPVVKARSK